MAPVLTLIMTMAQVLTMMPISLVLTLNDDESCVDYDSSSMLMMTMIWVLMLMVMS